MSVSGSAGGRNFVSANRVFREEPCPAIVPSAIESWFPGQAVPKSVLCSGAVPRSAGGGPTIVIRVTIGPRRRVRGHHPPRRNPAAGSRITPQRAITKTRTRGMLETTIDRSERPGRRDPVRAQTYEITFLGQAGTTLSAEFDDCEVTIGPGTTTLRADLPDQGALSGLIERISGLGLEVIDVSLVALPPGDG